jgi:hypothetical protein
MREFATADVKDIKEDHENRRDTNEDPIDYQNDEHEILLDQALEDAHLEVH